jgi:hypothetical protein
MDYWYYAPWQYELRERLDPEVILSPRTARGIPSQVKFAVLAGAAFLAYAPLLQPGPPAKTPPLGILPIYQVGGGMIV